MNALQIIGLIAVAAIPFAAWYFLYYRPKHTLYHYNPEKDKFEITKDKKEIDHASEDFKKKIAAYERYKSAHPELFNPNHSGCDSSDD